MRSDKLFALRLRRRGRSYTEISRQLGVPKSTLSAWLKPLRYSQAVRQRLSRVSSRKFSENISTWNRKRAERYAALREERVVRAADEVPSLNRDRLFWFGLALYWAEGSKKDRFCVRFANSDPCLVQSWLRFLTDYCEVPRDRILLTIHLHPNISERKAKRFWSETLAIPLTQFRRSLTQLSLSSQRKRPYNTLPYGTCRVHVGSSLLKQQLEGWMRGMFQQVEKGV